jgi:hypothetical protein
MAGISALLVAHVIFTSAGYIGLITTNLAVLVLCGRKEPALVAEGVSVWRRLVRLFGPILGIGVLLGLWLAGALHVGFTSLWLLVTYALVFVALGTQAAIMVPWQFRAQNAAALGTAISVRPLVTVLSAFTVVYVCIVSLMILRPS